MNATTANHTAGLMPTDSASAPYILVRHGCEPFFADSLAELMVLAELCMPAYLVELYPCGSVVCTELPPVESLDLGVYALPLAV